MDCDFLIIGQGIAGTLLSHELLKAGKRVHVVHDSAPLKASMAAGGLINPFSSRDWTRMKTQDRYLPVSLAAYKELEQLLSIQVLQDTSMLVCHETEEKRLLFAEQKAAFPEELQDLTTTEQQHWQTQFDIPHGISKVQPLYIADAGTLLRQWQHYLQQSGSFTEAVFNPVQLHIHHDYVTWGNIRAAQLIFCEGSAGQSNPLFPNLPFTRNRGEALLVSIPGLPLSHIYHHGVRLVPRSDGLFWCGSNYKWTFTDLEPDAAWRIATQQKLEQWLKRPFHIEAHLVAERPTTAGQQVLTRQHPEFPHIALFNGLGTRGFSSGPYYAQLFAGTLCS